MTESLQINNKLVIFQWLPVSALDILFSYFLQPLFKYQLLPVSFPICSLNVWAPVSNLMQGQV